MTDVARFTAKIAYPIMHAPNGWAFSLDLGQSWNICNFSRSGCNGGMSVQSQAPSNIVFCGDTQMIADGLGNVAYVSMASSTGVCGSNQFIVATLSTDGGRTFGKTSIVNALNCNNGRQDQPTATFDTTTSPPTLWVAWRHSAGDILGVPAAFGGCITSGTVNADTGQIDFLTPAFDIDNLQGDFTGVGGIIVQAGDGAVTIAYSSSGTGVNMGLPDLGIIPTPLKVM